MTRIVKTTIYVSVALMMAVPSLSAAQEIPAIRYQPDPDSPILARNPSAPAALSEFDFVIGDWDATITWSTEGREPLVYNAKWHNHWVVDGQVVMQEWRGPFITGAELRAFNSQTKTWVGQNIYPGGAEPWHKTTAKFANDMMMVTIEGNSDERGTYLNRETYYDIMTDSFKMKSERSYDGGETWEEGTYEMTCRRTGT